MDTNDIKKLSLPKKPGSYQFFNGKGGVIYVGKAADLRSRVSSYWQKSAGHSPFKERMMKEIAKVEWIETESEIEAFLLEANLIKKYQPDYNILKRDDKRFAYIKVSTEDEIPGVFVTRQIDRAGVYFGPFVYSRAVRETIKAIRKIWPYCNERKVKEKPCFYYQINRCLGVCGGKIEIKEYKEKVIKPILLFLSGKKKSIVKEYEKEAGEIERKLKGKGFSEKEKILFEQKKNAIMYFLNNIKSVLEHTNVISLADKYEADVVELGKLLRFANTPERIEGYDISNIFGQEAVGSMVVFKSGDADKSEYRKFKIRLNEGSANDTAMLKEVLERRFKNGWPMPDLIIIDGGKGQLNACLRVLKKLQLTIPAIAVSKGQGLRSAKAPDKLFFPGERQALSLPLASPALHIIKRVRDEAHRFAITYHRELRKRKWLK